MYNGCCFEDIAISDALAYKIWIFVLYSGYWSCLAGSIVGIGIPINMDALATQCLMTA